MTDNLALWEKLGKTDLAIPKVYGSVADRIANRVATEPNSGCWLWLGAVGRNGYGTITVDGRTRMAHRASYEAFIGPIPSRLHIDHKCKVRCCVNPDHLEPVTVAENNRRSPSTQPLKTHCKHGHPFSGENLQVGRQRRCRECSRQVALRSYHRRMSANV